mmetsp:Transcript_3314/g.13672  ORF Transcript_3314/g.13672 Transcript_3314/m.13672 type:complete len:311 (-) Transcript_3314:55-987(-)
MRGEAVEGQIQRLQAAVLGQSPPNRRNATVSKLALPQSQGLERSVRQQHLRNRSCAVLPNRIAVQPQLGQRRVLTNRRRDMAHAHRSGPHAHERQRGQAAIHPQPRAHRLKARVPEPVARQVQRPQPPRSAERGGQVGRACPLHPHADQAQLRQSRAVPQRRQHRAPSSSPKLPRAADAQRPQRPARSHQAHHMPQRCAGQMARSRTHRCQTRARGQRLRELSSRRLCQRQRPQVHLAQARARLQGRSQGRDGGRVGRGAGHQHPGTDRQRRQSPARRQAGDQLARRPALGAEPAHARPPEPRRRRQRVP